MVRATTGGVLRGYRSNLMNSFVTLNKARETVLTQRNFNSYAENPASAAQAFQLRKARMDVESQYNVCDSAYRKYQTAWSCLDTTDKLIDTDNGSALKTLKGMTLKMLNDPTGDARKTLSTALGQLSDTIVQTMNQKYGDNFIFAGADGKNVPFEVIDEKLYYRGVPVDADVPNVLVDDQGNQLTTGADDDYILASAETVAVPQLKVDGTGNPLTGTDANGQPVYILENATSISDTDYNALSPDEQAGYIRVTNNGTTEYYKETDTITEEKVDDLEASALKGADGNPLVAVVDGVESYIVADSVEGNTITQADYDKAVSDKKKLDYLVNEKNFVDIGLGFQENEKGQLIESSAFNEAMNGLTFLGYGLDEDGDPKNIYSLVQKMKDVAERVKDGENWTDADYEEFKNLVGKMEIASSEFKVEYTNMDAGTTKLKNNLALLEDNFYNLQEQYAALEDVDMADAITSFVWAQYCYNAALKAGNSVLSESLMDYLN